MAHRRTIKNRRKQNREEIQDDILQIAREMMREDGVGALSFNAIARELGIKPPSLYTYFDSKNAIYDALFKHGFELFGQKIKQHKGGTFSEQFSDIITIHMTFAYENPDLFQIMFQRPIPEFEPSDEAMAVSLTALSEAQDEIRQLFELEGINPDMSAEQALDLMIAMMHGLASLHLANHPELPVGEGRFGQVITHAATIFAKAWQPK